MRIELKYLRLIEFSKVLLQGLKGLKVEDASVCHTMDFLISIMTARFVFLCNFLLALDLANFLKRRPRFGLIISTRGRKIMIESRPILLYHWLRGEVFWSKDTFLKHAEECSFCSKYRAKVSKDLDEIDGMLRDLLKEIVQEERAIDIENEDQLPVGLRDNEICYNTQCMFCGNFMNIAITTTILDYLIRKGEYTPCHNAENCILGLYHFLGDTESYCKRVDLVSNLPKWLGQGYIDTDDIQLCSRCRKLLEG